MSAVDVQAEVQDGIRCAICEDRFGSTPLIFRVRVPEQGVEVHEKCWVDTPRSGLAARGLHPGRPACPGCGSTNPSLPVGDCCEYENLKSGRSHYCGKQGCYCLNLRKFMRRSVLESFIPERTP